MPIKRFEDIEASGKSLRQAPASLNVHAEAIMQTAQVVSQGPIQSVRLPEELRIEGAEVFVKRVGRSLMLIPKTVDPWEMLQESLDEFTVDYMEDRGQPPQQQREAFFE